MQGRLYTLRRTGLILTRRAKRAFRNVTTFASNNNLTPARAPSAEEDASRELEMSSSCAIEN